MNPKYALLLLPLVALAALGFFARPSATEHSIEQPGADPTAGWIHVDELPAQLIERSTSLTLGAAHGCVDVTVLQLPGPEAQRKVLVVACVFAVGREPDAVQGLMTTPALSANPIELLGDLFEVSAAPKPGLTWGSVVSENDLEIRGHEDFYELSPRRSRRARGRGDPGARSGRGRSWWTRASGSSWRSPPSRTPRRRESGPTRRRSSRRRPTSRTRSRPGWSRWRPYPWTSTA